MCILPIRIFFNFVDHCGLVIPDGKFFYWPLVVRHDPPFHWGNCSIVFVNEVAAEHHCGNPSVDPPKFHRYNQIADLFHYSIDPRAINLELLADIRVSVLSVPTRYFIPSFTKFSSIRLGHAPVSMTIINGYRFSRQRLTGVGTL